MGWCRYVQITWATSCGTAVSHEDFKWGGVGYKRVVNRPAYTLEHKRTLNYTYANTLTPILTLPAACGPARRKAAKFLRKDDRTISVHWLGTLVKVLNP